MITRYLLGLAKGHDCSAPATGFGGGIAEIRYEIGSGKNLPHYFALHADAAPVDDSQRAQAQAPGLQQVLLHHPLHVAWRNGVQVKHIRNGNRDRFVVRLHILKFLKMETPGQPKPTGRFV
jgi:hypothetical protein